jgi:hypothetical protein
MHFTNGKKAEVRLIDEKADGKYFLQTLGNNILGNWNKHYHLTDAENKAIMNGEGVWYSMALNGATLCLSINDTVVKVIDLSAEGITSVADIDQVKLTVYNFTYAVDVPYIIHPATAEKPPVEEGNVALTIPTFANGSVVPKKASYKAGETVSLIIAPTKGYSQKLYINGEPLMLGWKTDIYTFVAEEGKTYEITGSFEKANVAAMDAGIWDYANQAHGILNAYYPSNNDAWWFEAFGEYESVSVKTKNYLTREESMDNDPAGHVGYSVALRFTIAGKTYAFRIYNDKGTYAYSRSGASGSVTGWGSWKRLDDAAVAAIGGDGVDFKLERTGANTLTISVNGVVVDTYTIDGVTEADKVTAVGIAHYGNKGARVEIPFEVK